MDYKINSFNLADIEFNDLSDLSIYFDNQIFKQQIHNILLGPNLINFNYPTESTSDSEECEKIFETLSRLILGNLEVGTSQSFILNSTTHLQSKLYLGEIITHLNRVIETSEVNNENENTEDELHSLHYLQFISLFTCFKDKSNDENAICGNILIIKLNIKKYITLI